MRSVSKSELKARMLQYFREVERTGEELIVLDHRVPVLRVVPIRRRRRPADVFGRKRKVTYGEDPLAPTVGEWTET